MKSSQPATRKRFYKSAAVGEREDGGYAVLLDGRQVKTPAGKPLAVPARGLAEAIAAEWNAQGENIVPASLPLTKLANTAIDAVAERKAEVVDDIVKYAATDLVCYRAEYPAGLVAAQAAAWDPSIELGRGQARRPVGDLRRDRACGAAGGFPCRAAGHCGRHGRLQADGAACHDLAYGLRADRAGPCRGGTAGRRRLGRRQHGRATGRLRTGARTSKRPSA